MPTSVRRFPASLRVVSILLALAAGGAAILLASRPTAAEEPRPGSIVYVNVSGDGPTSKAWFKGAPPTGMQVQDALDQLVREGYRVHSVTAGFRPSFPANSPQPHADSQYLILLTK
jgi:hypothetical protein